MLGSNGLLPGLLFDAPLERFSSLSGSCGRMDLEQATSGITLKAVNAREAQGPFALLSDLKLYESCNSTFQTIQQLEKSADCKRLIDLLLYRDVRSVLSVPEGTCQNPCLFDVQKALEDSARECRVSFRGNFLSSDDVYKKRIYKKLHLAATASTYSKVICLQNHHDDYCTQSIHDFAELFKDCSLFTPSIHPFTAPFSMATVNTCPDTCREALQRYQTEYGCCAASVSGAATELSELLSDPADTAPFVLDLG